MISVDNLFNFNNESNADSFFTGANELKSPVAAAASTCLATVTSFWISFNLRAAFSATGLIKSPVV